jgi:D-alanyl-D-alanine carboxypeptidase/D-alanyl-D-alanine-endopeptidase (penicillin-binding protein 4)
MKLVPVLLALLLVLAASPAMAKQKTDPLLTLGELPNASLLFEENGKEMLSKRADEPMVPASTLKIVTALAAIDKLGLDYRFTTDFHLDDKKQLWVIGSGDPFMVSEELDLVATALKERGMTSVNSIVLDGSRYGEDLFVDGRTDTDNPYDAPLSALAVNFNTVAFQRKKGKGLLQAEKQTPLTKTSRQLGEVKLKGYGANRVNLKTRERAETYFGELLVAKLGEAGISVKEGETIRFAKWKGRDKPFYRHENSRNLGQVIKSMLASSSNFIANTLFLYMADKGNGNTLEMADARREMRQWIKREFGWKDYSVIEGSGLSRGNSLTARQLLQAVKAFEPYRELMPRYKGKVRAKTGTLRGVSCYAGFVNRKGAWQPFCLLINQPVSGAFRKHVAEAMADNNRLPALCDSARC